jgi:hypothetical protein
MTKINHPPHYNRHPSGVEAIDLCELLGFNLGNAVKYLMRAPHKGQRADDLRKARWYLMRESERSPVQQVRPTASHVAEEIGAHEDGRTALGRLLDAIAGGTVRLDEIEQTIDRLDAEIDRIEGNGDPELARRASGKP